ncbi:hypothetical protein FOA52_011901 [Chlamydomonas sp. UWO 241]|nr:hypothetical protein FOA52_011901 [Chlamydomonas sp. UWO 241]
MPSQPDPGVPFHTGAADESSYQRQNDGGLVPAELAALLAAIPFTRLAIWFSVAAVAYQLKDFFGLMMGTFIITFIGNSVVDRGSADSGPLRMLPPAARRRALAIVYFGAILAVFVTLGVVTIPDVSTEGVALVKRLQSDTLWVVLVEKMRAGLGDQVMGSLEKAVYLATNNDITKVGGSQGGDWSGERIAELGQIVSKAFKPYTTTAAKVTASLLSSLTKFMLQMFISLVLAFMMVWDLPTITRGVQTLAHSRLAPVYNEVAPVLVVFGRLFGMALEVQGKIALLNTALTAFGMWLLAIPGMGILSLLVFTGSFIPIAGCIISTVPIAFVALTEYGFMSLGCVILMVVVVHFVEAYLLNPVIYSASLKLHPLIIVSVLVVAEHTIGVWGLMLAVPLTVFALDYCIRYPESSITDVGKAELSRVMASMDGGETLSEVLVVLPSPAGGAQASGSGAASGPDEAAKQ